MLLIDESYNANPASMRAALATLATVPRAQISVAGSRCSAICWNSGRDGPALHRDLFDAVDDAGTDVLFACGPLMKGLYDAAPAAMKGGMGRNGGGTDCRLSWRKLEAGDVMMVKASNGTRLGAARRGREGAIWVQHARCAERGKDTGITSTLCSTSSSISATRSAR